jgi:hypothetical protein
VGCAHPSLDRPEGMLDRLATLAYFFRVLVEPSTRRDTVEIAVVITLQKSRRMTRGSTRPLRIDTAETQLTKIKLVNKDINHANRINSSTQSCRHSAKSVDCPRSAPHPGHPLRIRLRKGSASNGRVLLRHAPPRHVAAPWPNIAPPRHTLEHMLSYAH